MMTEHLTSTSWLIFIKVLSVNKFWQAQFVNCLTKRKIWKDICSVNKQKLFPALIIKMMMMMMIIIIIIHQTHYEKSDWSWAFNQFTIDCELDMINVLSAADNTFIMSSSMSAWLLSPLVCSPQKQNGWMLRFCFWIMCYLPQPSASADNTDLGFDNSWYHAQPHPIIIIIVYYWYLNYYYYF